MNQKQRLLRAIRRETVDRPPAAVPTQNAIVEVMEKSGFQWPAAQKKAREMAGLAWACHEIGGIESVRIPFDINVEAEAMGCETRFSGDVDAPPMTTPLSKDAYSAIKVPEPVRDGRMPEVLEAILLLKEKTRDEVPVIVACGTPFELLSTTLSFEDITDSIYEDPEFLEEQMKKMTVIAKTYAHEIEKRDPDVLMLVDGTSQALSPQHFSRFSFPFTKALVESLQKPTILHICGNATPLLEEMAATGVTALSIDKPVDITAAQKIAKGKTALVGNISPHTLCLGSREEIVSETDRSITMGLDVIAPGCGILPQTPLENLKVYINRVVSLTKD